MRALPSLLGAALSVALLAGCPEREHLACECAPCPLEAGVWIFVTDAATGSPSVPGATADGFACGPSPFAASVTTCHAPFRGTPGAYLVSVGAPGHAPQVVRVDESAAAHPPASGCCPPCPSTLELHVALATL